MCQDGATSSVPLYFINGSKTLGANESDVRCLGDAISGTASFTKNLILGHQRFYKFTPSQCEKCAARLGRPLPMTCMKRVYTDNLDVINVPCARSADLLGGPDAAQLVVVDAEGEDDHVVARLLDIGRGVPPPVLIYEQSHLRPARRAALAQRLRDVGMRTYNRTAHRMPPRSGSVSLSPSSWTQIRHVLARIDARDNAGWVVPSSGAFR